MRVKLKSRRRREHGGLMVGMVFRPSKKYTGRTSYRRRPNLLLLHGKCTFFLTADCQVRSAALSHSKLPDLACSLAQVLECKLRWVNRHQCSNRPIRDQGAALFYSPLSPILLRPLMDDQLLYSSLYHWAGPLGDLNQSHRTSTAYSVSIRRQRK